MLKLCQVQVLLVTCKIVRCRILHSLIYLISFFFLPFMQRVKTRVIKKTCNPVWNDELTLSITNTNDPIVLVSYILPTNSSIFFVWESMILYSLFAFVGPFLNPYNFLLLISSFADCV